MLSDSSINSTQDQILSQKDNGVFSVSAYASKAVGGKKTRTYRRRKNKRASKTRVRRRRT
jgi:hypothetical protein